MKKEDGPYAVVGDGPLRGVFFSEDCPLEWREVGQSVEVDGITYTIVVAPKP